VAFRADLRAREPGSAEQWREQGRQLTADEAAELALDKLSVASEPAGAGDTADWDSGGR
jgi:hypothetical protein